MALSFSRKFLLGLAAAATASFGFVAPAAAGGVRGHVGVHAGHYAGFHHVGFKHRRYYGGRGYYRGRGFHGRRYYGRRYHRGGGGKAAAIALGVVGGAIILNEIAEANDRRRYARSYDPYYDPYPRRPYPARAYPLYDTDAYQRGFEEGYSFGRSAGSREERRDFDRENEAFQRGFEEGFNEGLARGQETATNRAAPDAFGSEPFESEPFYDDGPIEAPRAVPSPRIDEFDLDEELEGAAAPGPRRADGGPLPIRYDAREAYAACTAHARRALGERGFILAAPPSPDTAESLGGAWKLTANVSAQARSGESWSRAMYCEADAGRVYMMELI